MLTKAGHIAYCVPDKSMPIFPVKNPRFIFLKQTAPRHHFFRELCEDIAGSDPAVVFSDIESHRTLQIAYIKCPDYDRSSARSRAASWLKFLLRSLYVVEKVPGRPELFIVNQPPLMCLVGYLQYKLHGRPYVLWIDDVWPDVLVRRGIAGQRSLIVRLWRALNRLTYGHAAHIITIGPYMRKTIQPYALNGTPISVVPTWVDSNVIRPISKQANAFAQTHGQEGKITILYSGNMGATHDMKSIVEAARLLRDHDNMHFMLLGAGEQFEWVRSSCHDLPNVTVLPLQPPEIFPQSLATGDIALICMERGIEGISMPSKTYASLAAGSAVLGICAHESDLTALIEECDCGRWVEPQSPQAIVDALIEMTGSVVELARMRKNARVAAEERFSRPVCIAMVKQILEAAEQSPSPSEKSA
jgi:glycosyltransferase involved in cell wall biosynthesis